MTNQSMAELVAHLEQHEYVVREPDPTDRRAKLVIPTAKGPEVFEIVRELDPEIEREVESLLGADRTAALLEDLQRLRASSARSREHTTTPNSTDELPGRP